MPYRIWPQLDFWPVLSVLFGLVFLITASFKGYEIATEVLAENSLLTTRWVLMAVVEWEFFIALWLLGGFYRNYPRTTRWVILVYFFALFEVAVESILSGDASCPCLGKTKVVPWVVGVFDLVAVGSLAAVSDSAPVWVSDRRQWVSLAIVAAVFGTISMITMGDYGTMGAVPQLRKDRRLHNIVTIEIRNPTTEQILDIGNKAAGVSLKLDAKLKKEQPDYGSWSVRKTRLWAVMELLVNQQVVPARWEKTDDGYAMIPAAPFGKSKVFWVSSAILLLIYGIGLRLLGFLEQQRRCPRREAGTVR